jgi:hypothetical protein
MSAPPVSLEALLASLSEVDSISVGRKQCFEHLAHDLLVIDDEYGTFLGHTSFRHFICPTNFSLSMSDREKLEWKS